MRRAALLLLFCTSAFADGGRVLLRQETGHFLVTVFLAPSDLSVMVQDRTNLSPVLDASVTVQIADVELRATHQQAQNKLLYATPIAIEEPGPHAFTVTVNHEAISGTLDITPPSPMLAANWQYLALPPVFIALFVLREYLVRRRSILVR